MSFNPFSPFFGIFSTVSSGNLKVLPLQENLIDGQIESITLFNEYEEKANVYINNQNLIAQLRRMAEIFSDKVNPEHCKRSGAVSYIVPMSSVSVRKLYSEARLKSTKSDGRPASTQGR